MESSTVITLVLRAIERVNLQAVFDRDPYESRRTALPGARLVKALVVYQMIKSPRLRGLIVSLRESSVTIFRKCASSFALPNLLGRISALNLL